MIHSRSGAMRQHVASPCPGRRLQQAGNANGVANFNTDRFGNSRRHEVIPKPAAPLHLSLPGTVADPFQPPTFFWFNYNIRSSNL
jgi:hypothetical protein